MGNNACKPCSNASEDNITVDVTDTPAMYELKNNNRENIFLDSTSIFQNCNNIALIFANDCSIPAKLQLDVEKQVLVLNIHNKIHHLYLNEISHIINKRSAKKLQKSEKKLLDNPTIVVLSLLPSFKAIAMAFATEIEAQSFAKFITESIKN